MKLLLLLAAIYSLIFYQQYKIEKAKGATNPISGPKTLKSYREFESAVKPDYGTASLLLRSRLLVAPQREIGRLGFY